MEELPGALSRESQTGQRQWCGAAMHRFKACYTWLVLERIAVCIMQVLTFQLDTLAYISQSAHKNTPGGVPLDRVLTPHP